MAIHFNEKYLGKLVEGFQKVSETESLFSHDLDMEFSGNKTVHVKSLKTEELNDYDRTANPTTGSRYGVPSEVEDFEQTFTITKDRSKSLTIDRGNEVESGNLKGAGKVMKAYTEERIKPEIDTYRLNKWAEEAGIHKGMSAPTKSTIIRAIIDLHNDMLDAGVPEEGCTLLIKRQYLPDLKTADEWVNLDSLGGKSLPKGSVGMIDNMAVKPITSKKFPANAYFMILYKGSVISPVRFKDFKIHKDAPGINGNLIEFRMMYDAFVLGHKADGVAVACASDAVSAAPTLGGTASAVTMTASGATIKYTLDGSDPRYSADAETYGGSSIEVPAGTLVRAAAKVKGKFVSTVAEKQY